MEIIKYIILGIIQGITEPIPVSSSGHLFLFKNVFNTNMGNDLNFEIIVNFGSFIAILFIFRKDILKLIRDFFKYIFSKKSRDKTKVSFHYAMMIVVGTIPAGIAGFLLKDFLEEKFGNIKFLGIAFLITAIALFLVRNLNGQKKDEDIKLKHALIIGFIQVIALIPGISRSGSVLVGCLLCGLNKESALKYTFMLYFPISIGSMILGVTDLISTTNLNTLLIPYVSGMIAACFVTYFSYNWLSKIVKKGKLWKFSIYCIALAIFIFVYFR